MSFKLLNTDNEVTQKNAKISAYSCCDDEKRDSFHFKFHINTSK
jgi:hypothetical protein